MAYGNAQAGFCLVAIFFTLPETYGPVLLARKAQRIRKETGDSRYYAPMEKGKLPIRRRLYNILAMPFKILFLEPMLIAITVYQSVSRCPSSSHCNSPRYSLCMVACISFSKRTQLSFHKAII